MLWELFFQVTLIVASAAATISYGSYLSLVEDEAESVSQASNGSLQQTARQQDRNYEILTLGQALSFPIFASISLLCLFYFFAYLQYFLIAGMCFGAAFALYQLINDCLSRYVCTAAYQGYTGLFSAIVTVVILLRWVTTGDLICHDLLCCALCVLFLYTLRFPSLKVAAACLFVLLIYDAFWVFFSSSIFEKNVMVEVAQKQAVNPIQQIGEILKIEPLKHMKKNIELPIKLIYATSSSRNIMLGLGDIALPGCLIAYTLRCDAYLTKLLARKSEEDIDLESNSLLPRRNGKTINLFQIAMIGYCIGLYIAFIANFFSGYPQPALIYLVPFVLIPVCVRASWLGITREVWQGPPQSDDIVRYSARK